MAANVASLGGDPFVLGLIGSDPAGAELCTALETCGVRLDHILSDSSRQTPTKTRIVADNHHVVRLDEEDASPAPKALTDRLLQHLISLLASIDVVIVSDYAKGLLTETFLRQLIQAASQNGRLVIVDPKHVDCSRYAGAFLLTPNRMEAIQAAGLPFDREDVVPLAAKTLLERLQIKSLLITQGSAGMTLFEPGKPPLHIPATARAIYDVTGAGDTVIAALGLAVASGAGLPEAATLANLAAGLSVEKIGTSTVTSAELENVLQGARSALKAFKWSRNLAYRAVLAIATNSKMKHRRTVPERRVYGIIRRAKVATVLLAARCTRTVLAILLRLMFKRFVASTGASSIRRILVYRIGNVGDLIVAIPTLALIQARFPGAHICLLTSPGYPGAPVAVELISGGGFADSIFEYHSVDLAGCGDRLKLIRQLRSMQVDLFIEFSNVLAPLRHVLRDMALAKLCGCRFAVGFQARSIRWFLREQALFVPQVQESDRLYLSLSADLDLPPQQPIRLTIPERHRTSMLAKISEAGIREHDSFVVMHVGAKRPLNRWMTDRYASVADMVQRRHNLRVVLTGSGAESELVQQVMSHMRTSALNLCGRLGLSEMMALLERASLYIGNDTGPMHISAAVGTPTVSIFSARDLPVQWFPYGEGHLVLRRDVPCSPCLKEVCSHDLLCLDKITVDDVVSAVDSQVAQLRNRAKTTSHFEVCVVGRTPWSAREPPVPPR